MESDRHPEPAQVSAARFQFSFRDALAAITILAVGLALTTQLRHLGFVAACFIAFAAAAWRIKRWRLAAGALTGLLVFAISQLASWLQFGYAFQMDTRSTMQARRDLGEIRGALEEYAARVGDYPKSLTILEEHSKSMVEHQPDLSSNLGEFSRRGFQIDADGEFLAAGGKIIQYRRMDHGFDLTWLGRDGRIGGSGLDADLALENGALAPQRRLPLRQFLYETRASSSVFLVALLASLIAAGIVCGDLNDARPRGKWLVIGMLATTAVAVAIAVFLALFHVAASQSGH